MRRRFFIWLTIFLAKCIKWSMQKRFNEDFTPKPDGCMSISIFQYGSGKFSVHTINHISGVGFFKVSE